MSPQSTREKMRRAVKRAINNTEQCLNNLKALDEIAEEQSEFVSGTLPIIVNAQIEFQKALNTFLRSL